MDVKSFFETIFQDGEGFLFIGWKDSDGDLNQFKSFKYPETLDSAVTFADLHKDIDLYFSPMLYKMPRRKKTMVCYTPVVYADTDQFDPERFLLKPTINVQTSEGRTHSYWVLDKGDYSVEEVSRVARAVAHTHSEKDENGKDIGVDPGGWDLTQLLRVPGSVHTKTGKPQPVFVRDNSGEIYSMDQFAEAYDPSKVKAVTIVRPKDLPEDLPKVIDVLPRVASVRKLQDLYSKEPANDSWSETLYLFVCEMLREGFTPEETYVVGWNAACNKYRRDGRPMEHFWEYDVSRAAVDPDNRPRVRMDIEAFDGVSVEDVEPITRPTSEGIAKELADKLFCNGEFENMRRTIVDDYVAWAASKTDAPEPYHIAGILTAMSLILGEWGVGDVQYGAQRLGLFFVVLGETTETRKTTARKLMKELIRMTEAGEFRYILTSDATEEALIDTLASRPHQSSLYDRDEVQKLIADIKGGKGYMSGFLETLNELYDGWARGRLRSNKETKDTQVNFVQYLMGIRSQFQDNLELEDFASGWGPRNLFVRGESPPRTREDSRLRQGSIADRNKPDLGLQRLAMKLTKARDYWYTRKKGDREHPERIRFEEDAWIQHTDLEWDLKEYFAEHPRIKYLRPSFERMSINVMKVAILFAMMDQRDMVNMGDVYNAQYYALQWVEDLVILIEGVSESYEQRHAKSILNYVLDGGGMVTFGKTYSTMMANGMSRREFYEAVETLYDSEVLTVVDDNKGRKSLSYVIERRGSK